jgi:glycosyltransferase involved in cell wall biosynthesis
MKIAFIHNVDYRDRFAYVNAFLHNAAAASKLGHRSTVYGLRVSGTDSKANFREACDFFGVLGKLKFVSVSYLKKKIRSFGIMSALLAKLNGEDLVWTRMIQAAMMSVKLGIPTLLEIHMPVTQKTKGRLLKLCKHPKCLGVVSISETFTEYLLDLGVDKNKIVTAHSGIDFDYVSNITSKITPQEKKVVGYGGSFYKGRGIEIIIACAKLLPDVSFRCFGGRTDEIEEFEKNGIPSNLQLNQKVPREQLLVELAKCNVLLAPYTKESASVGGLNIAEYQSPLKLIEYMAIGKPVICTNQGAIKFIVQNGQNGILVDEATPQGFATKLDLVFSEEMDLKDLGMKAKESAREYDWEVRVRKIMSRFFKNEEK